MNFHQRFFARKMLELRIRQSKGDAYQQLFSKVMGKRFPSFVPMRPYGNVGDRKNDGYIPDDGTFFQVYAPNDPESSLGEAAKKAGEDFAGLHKYWSGQSKPIKNYYFVYNDEYRGSIVPLQMALDSIKSTYNIGARPFLARHLEDETFRLSQDDIQDVIDCIIVAPDDISTIDYQNLREVIERVLQQPLDLLSDAKLIAPEFDSKIQFNGLSAACGDYLRVAARQNDAVFDYLSNCSVAHRQMVRDHLEDVYVRARTEAATNGSGPNEVFFFVMRSCTPQGNPVTRGVQSAVLAVLAYYFESCDIFEAPHASP